VLLGVITQVVTVLRPAGDATTGRVDHCRDIGSDCRLRATDPADFPKEDVGVRHLIRSLVICAALGLGVGATAAAASADDIYSFHCDQGRLTVYRNGSLYLTLEAGYEFMLGDTTYSCEGNRVRSRSPIGGGDHEPILD